MKDLLGYVHSFEHRPNNRDLMGKEPVLMWGYPPKFLLIYLYSPIP